MAMVGEQDGQRSRVVTHIAADPVTAFRIIPCAMAPEAAGPAMSHGNRLPAQAEVRLGSAPSRKDILNC